eukprot:GHVL01015577.1.p1 GENE.GHVL01015577.1~~GHVL01015577.1.p1  ORF type:complete len:421 (+),score=116.60 GHVL01015577.1:1541-2803(+)
MAVEGFTMLSDDDKNESNSRCGRWTAEEHDRFLEAIEQFGRDWRKVQDYVGTRTSAQARSHAQKYFAKLARHSKFTDCNLPPISSNGFSFPVKPSNTLISNMQPVNPGFLFRLQTPTNPPGQQCCPGRNFPFPTLQNYNIKNNPWMNPTVDIHSQYQKPILAARALVSAPVGGASVGGTPMGGTPVGVHRRPPGITSDTILSPGGGVVQESSLTSVVSPPPSLYPPPPPGQSIPSQPALIIPSPPLPTVCFTPPPGTSSDYTRKRVSNDIINTPLKRLKHENLYDDLDFEAHTPPTDVTPNRDNVIKLCPPRDMLSQDCILTAPELFSTFPSLHESDKNISYTDICDDTPGGYKMDNSPKVYLPLYTNFSTNSTMPSDCSPCLSDTGGYSSPIPAGVWSKSFLHDTHDGIATDVGPDFVG